MKLTHLSKLSCIAFILLLSAKGLAQNDAKIKSIADKACDCSTKISTSLKKDKIIEEINSCINSQTLLTQMTAINSEVEASAKNRDSTGGKKNYTIVMDENFKEIQAYMFDNCPAVKLLMTTNDATNGKALSKNKKALQFYQEGQDYSAQQKYDLALVSYSKAVKSDPKFVFAWDNLGLSYRRLNNYKEAIKCYQKSLEIDPEGTMPLQNIAIAYEYLKDYKQASLHYEKIIKAFPDNPEGYYGAGRTFYTDENYEKGVDYMFKAYLMYTAAKSPYVNDAQTVLASYYKDLKEKNKLEIFNQAAKNNNVNIKE
jgi:tetratricopeptide (TPR) repeat protein